MLLGAATGITTGGRRAATALRVAMRIAGSAAIAALLWAGPAGAQEHQDAQALADQAIRKLDLQSELHRRLLSIDFIANSAIPLRYGRGCIFLRYP